MNDYPYKIEYLKTSAAVFESSVYRFTWPVTRLWACSSMSEILYFCILFAFVFVFVDTYYIYFFPSLFTWPVTRLWACSSMSEISDRNKNISDRSSLMRNYWFTRQTMVAFSIGPFLKVCHMSWKLAFFLSWEILSNCLHNVHLLRDIQYLLEIYKYFHQNIQIFDGNIQLFIGLSVQRIAYTFFTPPGTAIAGSLLKKGATSNEGKVKKKNIIDFFCCKL